MLCFTSHTLYHKMKMHDIGPLSRFLDLIQPAVLHSHTPFLVDNFPLWHPSQSSILGRCPGAATLLQPGQLVRRAAVARSAATAPPALDSPSPIPQPGALKLSTQVDLRYFCDRLYIAIHSNPAIFKYVCMTVLTNREGVSRRKSWEEAHKTFFRIWEHLRAL